jgi:integrase
MVIDMANNKLDAQLKKIEKVFNRAQVENQKSATSISDGTKRTYSDMMKAVLREANRRFGISKIKDLKPEHTQAILQDKIARGQSASNIRKTAHALEYFQQNAVKTRVFKEKHGVDITAHDENLKLIKDQGVIRKSENSHRYKANRKEAVDVIDEMRKRNEVYADIAKVQLLIGGRVSETIALKAKNINLDNNTVMFENAKGGLTNIVHINHLSNDEKAFLRGLKDNEKDGRLFRPKDENGQYYSDERLRRSVTNLAGASAKKIGIGTEEKTFSSHSFRGAYGLDRADIYARNHKDLDRIIKEKIKEQPRLDKRYKDFEKRIKDKVKDPSQRHIRDYEKIQWLVSTDLNHSRQDVVRYYVPGDTIKGLIKKYR